MDDLEKKKQELIKKISIPPPSNLSDYKKFALMRCQGGMMFFSQAELIVVCDTEEEVIHELEYRKQFRETGDKNVVMKNNKSFSDFYDSSQSGKKFEEIMNTPLDAEGQFFVLPFYDFS